MLIFLGGGGGGGGGGGDAKERVSRFYITQSVSISTAALVYLEIMSHLTVNLKKLERTFLLEVTSRN